MATSAVRRRRSAFGAGLATMAMALGFAAIPAEAAPPPRADYVALGDSYTAGTGAGAAVRPPVACWQSHPNYVDVVGHTGRVNLVANAACHGAVLSAASPFYDGVTPTVQQQLAVLAGSGQLSADTELVSITAGATDLGFSFALAACATSTEACSAALGNVATALPTLQAALVETYAAIHAVAPNATIGVLGYPLLFDPAGAPVIPVENQVMINQATLLLNATIESAVNTANVLYGANAVYIDVTGRFAKHAVNSATPWLVLDLSQPRADYNFHPNAAGYSFGYASALMGAVKPAQLARR